MSPFSRKKWYGGEFVGTPFASPSTVFQIDDHPDHAQAESGSRFERRADDAFSRSISHNLRISGEIRQFGTIRWYCSLTQAVHSAPRYVPSTHTLRSFLQVPRLC